MSEEMSDTIRSAIHKSGRSLPTIAKKTGVAVSALSESMDGADLHLTSASKIAAYPGLELKPSVQRKRVTMRPVKVIPPRKV